jgi:hypothetical protein
LHFGMYKVLLQNTFQSSMSMLTYIIHKFQTNRSRIRRGIVSERIFLPIFRHTPLSPLLGKGGFEGGEAKAPEQSENERGYYILPDSYHSL